MRTLGFARIFRTDDGELVMDQDSLRRSDFSGELGHDGYIEFGADYDDFEGEDDYDDDDDEDDEDDDSDDFEGDEDDEFGDAAARRSRRAKRKRSSAGRKTKRANRKLSRAEELESKNRSSGQKRRSEKNMQATVITEASTETTAGSVSITIRPNHDFDADNIVFDGSASTAKVNSVIFGDQLIFSNATGTPITVFASSNFLKGLLKGSRARIRSGETIVINGSIATDGDAFVATLTGKKPALRC